MVCSECSLETMRTISPGVRYCNEVKNNPVFTKIFVILNSYAMSYMFQLKSSTPVLSSN